MSTAVRFALFASLLTVTALIAVLMTLWNTTAEQSKLSLTATETRITSIQPAQEKLKETTATQNTPACALTRDSYVQSHSMLLNLCWLEIAGQE